MEASMAKADTPEVGSDELAIPDFAGALTENDQWWDESADEVQGYDLVKDEALMSLVGVPLRIYRATFRPGIKQKGCEWTNDYASNELRVAPAAIVLRDWNRIMSRRANFKLVTDKRAIAGPGEQLVWNDGSTGGYRQVVEYLEAKELITVPDELPKKGGKNECRYDLPSSYWSLNDDAIRANVIDVRFTPEGEKLLTFNIALKCTRGLRYSDYTNEYTDDDGALTWYIA